MAEAAILGYLEHKEEISDSGQFADERGIDHNEIVNVIKSLHGFRYVDAQDIKKETWILTEEGKTYATAGSPEVQLFQAIPPEGIPKEELQKNFDPSLFKIACAQAAKNKWVDMGKLVTRKVQHVDDKVKSLLLLIQKGQVVGGDEIKSLEARKLIAPQTWKGYSVKKGPNYAPRRKKVATDLTRENLQSGDWKELEFKEYNFSAKGLTAEGGHLHPLLKMSLVTGSPVNSSSSDDFAGLLDAALDSGSSDSSPGEVAEDDNSVETSPEDDNIVESERIKRPKVEKRGSSEEPHGSTSQEVSSKQVICTHPGSFEDMCIICGQRSEQESGVTFGYIHKGLRLNNDEIIRLRSKDMKNILRHKKLHLVLDLDHTLLNSTQLVHMASDEEYLKSQIESLEGSLFMLKHMHMMTKLRPFVRPFLKEASEMYEMHIYTMGDRAYALAMANLLDPRKEYFGERVISRDDGTQRHQKGLDIVLGQESAVLILDDTENAWTKHKENLILMERYHFFRSSSLQFGFNCPSLSEMKTDESETEGALANVLKVLKQIHNIFFDEPSENLIDRDVRQVLNSLRKEILKGCKIVFSHVFPTKFQAENHHLWKMAEQLGATCSTEIDESVTHVVSADAGTEKSRWAVQEMKFLVGPGWIEATNYMWKRQPEENFSVNRVKNPYI